jgi:AraC-like DNA-binding protein
LPVGSPSPVWKIHYIAAGTMTWQIGDAQIHVPPRTWLLVPPGVRHGGYADHREPGTIYWLHCRLSERGWPHAAGIIALLEDLHATHPVRRSLAEAAGSWEALIDAAGEPDTPWRPVRFEGAWLALLAELRETVAQAPGLSAPIARAQAWLAEHLDKGVSIAELAAVAGLGASRFRERFQAEVGLSPRDWRQLLQVDQARRLLRQTRRSILDIALSVGFSSSQNFATAFRRRVGCSPSTYRSEERR